VLKTLHVTAAVLSISGYFLRGMLMLFESPLLRARVMRIVPHVVDTILLASAIALAVRIHQYPLVHGWLTAKVLALIAYVVVGAIGLHYGQTKRTRALAFGAALLIFAYIVGVALTRQPLLGWL
jgi:uncharacterized membrane protein SirB2